MTVEQRRTLLNAKLVAVLGAPEVYFQPAPDVKMKYPCLVYEFDDDWKLKASNVLYAHRMRYQLTHISKSPTSPVFDKLLELEFCSFSRRFTTPNLYHDVFVIYH